MHPYRLLGNACAALIAVVFSGSAGADPLNIKVAWSTIPGHFAPLIPTTPKFGPDVYRQYGKSYVVEPIKLRGGGANVTALAAGETNIDTASPPSLVLGVTEAKLDLRVIGQQVSTEVPGYLYTYFWVRSKEVTKVEDLKGKIIAIPGRGGNPDAAVQMIMSQNGIKPEDYQITEIPFSAMIPALQSKRIDAGILVPPFNVMATKDPTLKPLFSVHDVFGAVETVFWMTKADYIAKNRAALVDFLEDNIRMRRWMFDPKTRMDAIQQVSDATKIPVQQYSDWIYTTKDYYYQPHALTDVERLQGNIDLMNKLGIIPTRMDVTSYVDLSLAKEAAARIKD
jgi:ABC-type nitrate/sulfonate/bicarbonate transport system substrate-binding protein